MVHRFGCLYPFLRAGDRRIELPELGERPWKVVSDQRGWIPHQSESVVPKLTWEQFQHLLQMFPGPLKVAQGHARAAEVDVRRDLKRQFA